LTVNGITVGRGGGNESTNTAIGFDALSVNAPDGDNDLGIKNTAIGYDALKSNTTGTGNTAIGYGADVFSSGLTNATAIGSGAKVYGDNTIVLGNAAVTDVLTAGSVYAAAFTAIELLNGQIKDMASFGVNGLVTSGTLTAGDVSYTNIKGNDGDFLKIDGSGNSSWAPIPSPDLTNYVTTNTAQTITEAKTFSKDLTVNGLTVGKGGGNRAANTATGSGALQKNTSGDYNTATGNDALTSNTTGFSNTAYGYNALYTNSEGGSNTAIGTNALTNNTTGSDNTASGPSALFNNTTGAKNIAIGTNALSSNTTGSNNTAIGYGANVGSNNLTNATAIGNGASVTASNTIQLGNTSITNVKTSGTLTAGDVTYPKTHNNTSGQVLTIDNAGTATWAAAAGGGVPYTGATGAVNLGAYDLTVNEITVGKGAGNIISNLVIGLYALSSNTSGSDNTAIGTFALDANTSGYRNTAIGRDAGVSSGSLFNTTAIGYNAKVTTSNTIQLGNSSVTDVKTSGNLTVANGITVGRGSGGVVSNSVIGFEALASNTLSGISNTAIGNRALTANTTGSYNAAIGNDAGRYIFSNSPTATDNTTSDYSVYLGSDTKASADGAQNEIVIGYNAIGAGSNTIQLGNDAITGVYTKGTVHVNGVALSSDLRLKSNIAPLANSLATVMQLNPVHYMKKGSLASKAYNREENGFIAQEIQKILPFVVTEGTDENKLLSVDYNSFIPVLTKAIQEQQKQIEDQNAKIAAQQKQIEELIKLVKGQK
jgi:NDP-sugar pyrophosphorylase family protein